MRVVLIIVCISMAIFFYTLDSVSEQYWKAVGPKWDCAFNPDYSEYCPKEEDGSN